MKTKIQKLIDKVEKTQHKVVRVNKEEFELEGGDIYPHTFELDENIIVEEFESGTGNFTIALVESADGTIVEVLPTNLQFILEQVEPPRPEYVCPYIARLELWIEHKISSEDFKELTHRMDKIREISTDLRHYAEHFKNQKQL